MAYCDQCGAYIPDGHTKCLACGHDESEAAKKTEAQAQAYEYKYEEPKNTTADFLREELEKQRRRQQENSRKWAETEKAQRERAKAQQKSQSAPKRSTDTKKYSAPASLSANKVMAALSYLGVLFILPYIFCDKDDFALFHAKQGLILFVVGIAAKIVCSIFGLGWLATLAKIYFIYKGISNVLNGKKEALPYIGTLF